VRLPLVVEPELTSRYSELVRLQKALRGVLMSVDLVVTSEARYDERSRIRGTVEYVAHREGPDGAGGGGSARW
jgi:hypothetical protein